MADEVELNAVKVYIWEAVVLMRAAKKPKEEVAADVDQGPPCLFTNRLLAAGSALAKQLTGESFGPATAPVVDDNLFDLVMVFVSMTQSND